MVSQPAFLLCSVRNPHEAVIGSGAVDIEAGNDASVIHAERNGALSIAGSGVRLLKEGDVAVAGADESVIVAVSVVFVADDRLVRIDTRCGASRCSTADSRLQ